jgi:hypothetical protein
MRHFHIPYGQWVPDDPADLYAIGVRVIILHQSNRLNPYINYPFTPNIEAQLKAYITKAKGLGMHVKLYYTVGQLSNHAAELFAMKGTSKGPILHLALLILALSLCHPSSHPPSLSLFAKKGLGAELLPNNPSDEPFFPPGKDAAGAAYTGADGEAYKVDDSGAYKGMGDDLMGNEWLEEHMVRGYEGGWFTMNQPRNVDEDASIHSDTVSRMVNYYISGQEYLYKAVGVAGLYYDGTWHSLLLPPCTRHEAVHTLQLTPPPLRAFSFSLSLSLTLFLFLSFSLSLFLCRLSE